MRKIRQWVNQMSVKKKLIIYGYMIFTPVMIIICVVLTAKNYQNVRDGRLETEQMVVASMAERWRSLQTEIKDFSTYICVNQQIGKILTDAHPEELAEIPRLWSSEAPVGIILDMIALKGYITSIAIYPENGVQPYLRGIDGSVNVPTVEQIHETKIAQAAAQSPNGIVWKYLQKGKTEIYEYNRSDKLVLFREIRDLAQKEVLGHITIGVKYEVFEKLSENTVGENEALLVLDANGGVLSRVGTLDETVARYLLSNEFIEMEYDERPENFLLDQYEVVCAQLDENECIVCKVIPKISFWAQLRQAGRLPTIQLIAMLLALIPLLSIISNIVTRPLMKLREAILEVASGNFEQQVAVETQDEVGEVAMCFNCMVSSIRELIEQNYVITLQEKESELAALQAQINPHFLYNTLDSLYWQAVEADNEEIAESILALSQLFRLVLNQGKSEVTVSHEAALVSRYLQIQKMRFTKRLEYSVEMDPAISKAKMPKLILQPFVENAIVHGFENMDVPCSLRVSGRLMDGKICFEIRDTGVGMRQDQIDEIWEEEPEQYRKQRVGRYAIKNIHERLQRKYQHEFSLEIQSEVGKGTVVTLMIPYEEE